MAMMKRVFYFAIVNILVMITISIVTSVICQFLYGTPYPPSGSIVPLIIWAGVWGMGGSFISLMLSKTMAKRMSGMKIIDPNTSNSYERRIVEKVHQMARQARLPKMPEVGIYQSQDMNAFATGPSRSNSLVAVSTGLMSQMNDDQVEGVLAHEVAHIANGDMVTMTLIQGIINAFVLFFARIIAQIVASQFERNGTLIYYGVFFGLQMLLGVLGSVVVFYFSRTREYRADAGAAKYSSRDKMISALRALQHNSFPKSKGEDALAAFKISTPTKGGWASLFRSHPPLESRIARLQRGH